MKYIAYGSNLLSAQMMRRCPDAQFLGTGFITGMRFEFRGRPFDAKATLVPAVNRLRVPRIPVAVWNLSKADEQNLDRYEGVPYVYRKERVRVTLFGGKQITGMVYLKNDQQRGLPTIDYYNRIVGGYNELGLSEYVEPILRRAVRVSYATMTKAMKSRGVHK